MLSFLDAIAAFLTGIFASMGMGGGSILIIYLTIFAGVQQNTAQGINLLFFIPIATVALIFYSKKHLIHLKLVSLASLAGILGAIIGSCLSSKIDNFILRKLFGSLLLFIGIKQLFVKNKP